MTSGHHPTLSFLIQQRVSGWWGPHGVGKHAVWSSSMLSTLHMLFLVSSTQIAACLFVNGTGHLSRLRIALRPKISIANIVAAQHYGTSTSIYATSTSIFNNHMAPSLLLLTASPKPTHSFGPIRLGSSPRFPGFDGADGRGPWSLWTRHQGGRRPMIACFMFGSW